MAEAGKHLSSSFKVDVSIEHGIDDKITRTPGEVTVDSRTNEVKNVRPGTKSKYQMIWFDPKLAITNESPSKVTPGARVRFMSLVESYPGYRVLNVHEVTIPPINPKCHHPVELEKVAISKFDERGLSLSAPKYAGYLVLIVDMEFQKILLTETDIPTLGLGDYKALLELKQYSKISKRPAGKSD